MHQAARFQFERVAREFSQWRSVPESERSPAPGWWWQPAFEVREQHEEMAPLCCHRLELPVASTYAAGAAVLMAILAGQKSLPWPDEFPRKIARGDEEHESQAASVFSFFPRDTCAGTGITIAPLSSE